MTRVLVTLTPQMYRAAVALAIHRDRPDSEVKLAPLEAAEAEIASFRPHLLVHNDTAPIPEAALSYVPWRVEVLYSDSMDVRIWAGSSIERVEDATIEDLLRVVDYAAAPTVTDQG